MVARAPGIQTKALAPGAINLPSVASCYDTEDQAGCISKGQNGVAAFCFVRKLAAGG
jgi:hypothetical protein